MTKKKETIISVALIAALLIVLYVLEQILPSTSMLFTVLKKGAIYALVAVSMNLLNGFTGLFSLGQAGFMLLGAYTYGILTIPVEQRENVYMYFDGGIVQFTVPVFVALIAAGVVAAIFAYLIGLPVLRLKSDYLAIATLGFAEIIRAVFQWDKLGPLTNGSNLLRSYPTFSSVLFPFIVSGAFKSIRDDEVAAEAMGINLAHHKRIAFVVSSFFAGVSGALLAMYQTTIQASTFKSAMTYEILLIVVIGGIGSVTGSCISSFLFIIFSEWILRFLDNDTYIGSFHVPLLRAGFRKVVLFFRQGIMGTREFSIRGIYNFLTGKSRKKKTAKGGNA